MPVHADMFTQKPSHQEVFVLPWSMGVRAPWAAGVRALQSVTLVQSVSLKQESECKVEPHIGDKLCKHTV